MIRGFKKSLIFFKNKIMIKYLKLLLFCYSLLAYSQEKLKVNYEVISKNTKVNFGNDFNLSEELKQQMLEKIEQQNKEPKNICFIIMMAIHILQKMTQVY